MSKRLVFIFISLIVMCGSTPALERLGVQGGVSMAKMRGDDGTNWDSRIAPQFGVYTFFKATEYIALQPQLWYGFRGGQTTHSLYRVRLTYLEPALLLRLDPKGWHSGSKSNSKVFFGLGLACNLSAEYDEGYETRRVTRDIGNIADVSLSLIIGGGFDYKIPRFGYITVDVIGDIGVTRITDEVSLDEWLNRGESDEVIMAGAYANPYDWKNWVISVMVGYAFEL